MGSCRIEAHASPYDSSWSVHKIYLASRLGNNKFRKQLIQILLKFTVSCRIGVGFFRRTRFLRTDFVPSFRMRFILVQSLVAHHRLSFLRA